MIRLFGFLASFTIIIAELTQSTFYLHSITHAKSIIVCPLSNRSEFPKKRDFSVLKWLLQYILNASENEKIEVGIRSSVCGKGIDSTRSRAGPDGTRLTCWINSGSLSSFHCSKPIIVLALRSFLLFSS